MPIPAVATIGAGLISAKAAKSASSSAAQSQSRSAQAGIDEQKRQFNRVQKLLQPYVRAGNKGVAGQLDLAGLGGVKAKQAAIRKIVRGPEYRSLVEQGEEGILQNAAATGGLRGGNTQAALAQFRPQILSSLIDKQYSQLGGLANLGQASAARVGAAGQASGNNISSLLGQQGAAQAGAALASGQANSDLFGTLGGAAGQLIGQFGQQNTFNPANSGSYIKQPTF